SRRARSTRRSARASSSAPRSPPCRARPPARSPSSPCPGNPSQPPSSRLTTLQQLAEQTAALVAAAAGGLEHALGRSRERQRLQRDVPGPGHVNEEEALAAEQAPLDAALELHVVAHGRLDHDQAAGVDDEPLPLGEVEVEEVAAAVQPDRALAPEALEAEALAAAHPAHAELLRERALDLDLADVSEVGVALADDLAVELVLADRARERPADPDRAGAARPVAHEEHALAGEDVALERPAEAARHLDVH